MNQQRNPAMLVQLAPRPTFDAILVWSSRIALVALGLIGAVAAAYFARTILAPITMAVVLGLMFGPVADRIERIGIPSWISAAAIVIVFISMLIVLVTSAALPLSVWLDRLPAIWQSVRGVFAEWDGLFDSIAGMQDGLREIIGEDAQMTVALSDGSPVRDVAWLAPAIMAQVLLFLASFYFFMATRNDVRLAILSLCVNRRVRWRLAHVFRDVENLVSRYLLSITVVNACLGIAVGLAMWLAGIPSPLLWGLLAFCLNYAIYIGPAIMAALMLGVGLATFGGTAVFLPPALYLSLNLLEAQLLTPTVVGRAVTMNPFIVFLALAFWLWLWGPVGGFVAVPLSLIAMAVLRNILPLAQAPARQT